MRQIDKETKIEKSKRPDKKAKRYKDKKKRDKMGFTKNRGHWKEI